MSHSIRKQLLLILLAVAIVLSLAVVFTACNKQHEHAFSTEWATDADYHWHEATCNDTREVKDRGQHSFNEDWKCTLCNYQHEHTFSEEWKSNGTNHWHEATCEHEDEKSDMNAHSYDEDGKCTVCGHQKPIVSEHQHSYSEQWTTDSDYHWHEATCEHEGEISGLGAHVFDEDGKCTECGYVKPAEPKHEHTYSDWLGDADGENHYKLPTCDDTDEMIGPFPHVDEDGDGACDVCLTTKLHQHSFSAEWSHDGEGHWKAATCKHSELKSEYAEHVDEDGNGYGDGVCDICGYSELHHEHKFEEEWTINESVHWHVAICIHFMERGDYGSHAFNAQGVCKCGVKKSYVDVYGLYSRTGNLTFVEWLRWLADKGVVRVEKTESGDGIYYYEDGTSEIEFLGDRTVTVKVVADDKPVQHAWVMVSFFDGVGYTEVNGTLALGIGETDENGIVEILFSPIRGYSAENKEYHVRLAEARDVAIVLGISEENAKPLPNRISLIKGYEYINFDVSENAGEDGPVEIKCAVDNGWYNYDKFSLPYKRYYADQLKGEGITETGATYTFTASGGNLFDYFYFNPSKYNVGSATPVEKDIIIEYATFAASGTYRIYFEVEDNVNAMLYFWGNDVNLDGVHHQKSDGSPHDSYISSVSGGVAGESKHTGGNYVVVNVSVGQGLKIHGLGIATDKECQVTLTVVRDENPAADYTIEATEDGKYRVPSTKITFKATETMVFDISAVPSGVYKLKVLYSSGTMSVGILYGYVDIHNKVNLYETKTTTESSSNNGVLRIGDSDNVLYIKSAGEKNATMKEVSLERYEMPEVNGNGETVRVPAAATSLDETYQIPVKAEPGLYSLTVEFSIADTETKNYPMTVNVGGREYTDAQIEVVEYTSSRKYAYTFTVEITEQETLMYIRCGTSVSFIANVTLAQSA